VLFLDRAPLVEEVKREETIVSGQIAEQGETMERSDHGRRERRASSASAFEVQRKAIHSQTMLLEDAIPLSSRLTPKLLCITK
jgi:hypothetical protein